MLERIIAHLDGQPASAIPPLMDWNPPLTGDMPLIIAGLPIEHQDQQPLRRHTTIQ